jgi:hypothetical protein
LFRSRVFHSRSIADPSGFVKPFREEFSPLVSRPVRCFRVPCVSRFGPKGPRVEKSSGKGNGPRGATLAWRSDTDADRSTVHDVNSGCLAAAHVFCHIRPGLSSPSFQRSRCRFDWPVGPLGGGASTRDSMPEGSGIVKGFSYQFLERENHSRPRRFLYYSPYTRIPYSNGHGNKLTCSHYSTILPLKLC